MYFNFRGGGVNFRLQAPDQVPVSTLCLSVVFIHFAKIATLYLAYRHEKSGAAGPQKRPFLRHIATTGNPVRFLVLFSRSSPCVFTML